MNIFNLTVQLAEHTPGDWQRNGNQIVSVHRDDDGEHETLICEVFDQHDWWKANARLITAAPGMLAALKFALLYMEDLANSSDNKYERHAVKLMREAICEAL
jgi:hypothetical protein